MQWPASLPQRLSVSGFSETLGVGGLRQEMDAGPAFQMPRYTAVVEPIECEIVINRAQRAIFKQFWYVDTDQGSIAFDWFDPIEPTVAIRVQFNNQQPPRITPKGLDFTARFVIEVLP